MLNPSIGKLIEDESSVLIIAEIAKILVMSPLQPTLGFHHSPWTSWLSWCNNWYSSWWCKGRSKLTKMFLIYLLKMKNKRKKMLSYILDFVICTFFASMHFKFLVFLYSTVGHKGKGEGTSDQRGWIEKMTTGTSIILCHMVVWNWFWYNL